MMNDIKTNTPTTFFPQERRTNIRPDRTEKSSESGIKPRNNKKRQIELKESTENDARVDISNKIKDFSRIKKAADVAPDLDNKNKVEELKKQVEQGTYKIDYDALADKILNE